MNIKERGTKGFFIYLKKNLPQLYDQVANEISDAGSLQGFGAIDPVATATEAPISSTLSDAIVNIAKTAAGVVMSQQQANAQVKIVQAQLQLAQQGKAPANIDPRAYGLPAAISNVSSSTWLTLAAVAGLLFFLVSTNFFRGKK